MGRRFAPGRARGKVRGRPMGQLNRQPAPSPTQTSMTPAGQGAGSQINTGPTQTPGGY